MTKLLKRFNRPVLDPKKEVVSLNQQCSVSVIPKRAVVIKQGVRIIAYYDQWPEEHQLEYIRDTFVQIILDPAKAPDPDWSVLAA